MGSLTGACPYLPHLRKDDNAPANHKPVDIFDLMMHEASCAADHEDEARRCEPERVTLIVVVSAYGTKSFQNAAPLVDTDKE
jgi:hypothetical protein